MPAPLFKVEVAFANGPNDAAPTYTDISQYVRRYPPLTYSRGNTDETQQLQPGQMSFTVDNTDGRFTVGSSASTSAWGTALKIRRPVRLSLWDGAAYQVAWTGTVDDWGASWLGGVKGLSRVTCSDRVASAGRITLGPALLAEMLTDGPIALYPLLDGAGATSAAEYFGGYPSLTPEQAFPGTSVTLGSSDVAAPGPDGGTVLANVATASFVAPAYRIFSGGPVLGSAPGMTFEAWVYVTGAQPNLPATVAQWGTSAVFQIDTAGRVTGSSFVGTPTVALGLPTNRWVHLALVDSISGGNITTTFYVNGVGTVAGSVAGSSITALGDYFYAGGLSGYVSHIGCYATALSAARIADRANAANAWAGEYTGARWNRLCRIAGLSSSWYAADTGGVPVAAQATDGQQLVSLLSEVLFAEQGTGFATAAGVLTMKGSQTRYSKSSTLTVAPQTAGPALEFTANDAYLVNDSTITTATGSLANKSDSTSKTDFGIYREQQTSAVAYDWTALNLAQFRVYRYKTPTARARGLAINGTTKASSITATQLLALDVNSRITLSPLTGPAPASSVQVFIDGLSGTVGDTWEVVFNTSPTTGLDGLVLDTSTLDNAASILLY